MNREFDFMPELPMEEPPQVGTIPGSPKADRTTAPQFFYQVAMPEPESHLFEVTLRVTGWPENLLDLKMPVWTPGSYLVREYARHLQDFAAFAGTTALPWSKVSKHHWQIHTQGNTDLTITYRMFANELTVRTNHLDSTHGYFNGAAIFFFVPEYEDCPIDLAIAPPAPTGRSPQPSLLCRDR